MKCVPALLIISLLLLPGTVSAQATPIVEDGGIDQFLPSIDWFGSGWTVIDERIGQHPRLRIERAEVTYVGPDGSRVLINLFDLSPTISNLSLEWKGLKTYWEDWANYYMTVFSDQDSRQALFRWPYSVEMPVGVNEAASYQQEGHPLWMLPVGVSLFAFDEGFAALVIVDGSFHGTSGTIATANIAAAIVNQFDNQ